MEMAERTEGEEEPEKGEEMEVKDKIEETKDEKGIKGTTLRIKTERNGYRDRTQLPR